MVRGEAEHFWLGTYVKKREVQRSMYELCGASTAQRVTLALAGGALVLLAWWMLAGGGLAALAMAAAWLLRRRIFATTQSCELRQDRREFPGPGNRLRKPDRPESIAFPLRSAICALRGRVVIWRARWALPVWR